MSIIDLEKPKGARYSLRGRQQLTLLDKLAKHGVQGFWEPLIEDLDRAGKQR